MNPEQQERVKRELKRRLAIARGIEIESGSAKDRAFVDGGIAAFELLLDDLSLLDSDSQAAATRRWAVSVVMVKQSPAVVNTQNQLWVIDADDRDTATGKAIRLAQGEFPEHSLHTVCIVECGYAPDAATAMRDKCVVHLQATADALDVRQETECPSGTAFNSEAALRRRIAVELQSLTLDPLEPEKQK